MTGKYCFSDEIFAHLFGGFDKYDRRIGGEHSVSVANDGQSHPRSTILFVAFLIGK